MLCGTVVQPLLRMLLLVLRVVCWWRQVLRTQLLPQCLQHRIWPLVLLCLARATRGLGVAAAGRALRVYGDAC
jgi:hypothetical protein